MCGELSHLLDKAEAEAQGIAATYRNTLNRDDHDMLVLAFHRAETLAEFALQEAREQVPLKYQAELDEQIADEQRHISVFAHWLQAPPSVPRPKSRRRPEVVWYAVLLANEIAGYCQFHMLAGLLADASHRAAVEEIARDERVHITRLTRWLRKYAGRATWGSVTQVTDAFRRRLDTRMQQFLPRDELVDVRTAMSSLIDTLLQDTLGLADSSRTI